MATLQNIGKLKYRGKDGEWHPLPVVVQDADGSVSTISGKGAPTSATQGKVNQLYRDEDTQKLYICTATDGGYTWAEVSGGSVDVDATLTKAGYAADAKAAGDAIGKKIDKAQGVENAGMILGVGEDGNVVPGDPSNLPGFVSYSMYQGLTYEQQEHAKQNIGAGTLRHVVYWNKSTHDTDENPNSVIGCASRGQTCICAGYGFLPQGMQGPVLVIYREIDRGYIDATAFDGSNATWTFTVNLRDYSYSTPIKKSGIPTPTTAQVGQIVKVKAVDAGGKITETEAVDMPGEEKWELIKTIDVADGTAETTALTIDTDNNGNAFSLKKCRLFARFPAYKGETTIPNYSFAVINKGVTGNHSPLCYTSGFPKLRTDGYTGTVWEVDVSGLQQYEKVMRTSSTMWSAGVYGSINSQTTEYWGDKRIQSITSIGGAQMIIFPGCHFELHGVRE